jgi:glycosyltransferase involved in cell wall biosynthesis
MAAQGLVSVIVPCFNYGRFLPAALRSLHDQSYAHWECMIVDDGSTDETPQVCAELERSDPRVKYHRQDNRGLSAARNAGIRRSNGEFVQFLDADDLIEPDKLQVQASFLAGHAKADIVMGPAAFFPSDQPSQLTDWEYLIGMDARGDPSPEAVLGALLSENISVVHAALVRRTVFEAVGLFDESLRAHEDWQFWIRCALAGRRFSFVAAKRDRALVRQHGANMSRVTPLMLSSRIAVRQKVNPLLSESLRIDNEERLAELKWRYGLNRICQGELREGWRLYRDGLHATRHKSRALSRLVLLIPGIPAAAQLWRSSIHTRGEKAP